MIWSGGRISLTIGVLASLIAAAIAIFYGAVSGCAPAWLDELLMRLSEIFLSVPNLLLVILLQAAFGKAGILSLSVVIGVTSWAEWPGWCARRCGRSETVNMSLRPGLWAAVFLYLKASSDTEFHCLDFVYGSDEYPQLLQRNLR